MVETLGGGRSAKWQAALLPNRRAHIIANLER